MILMQFDVKIFTYLIFSGWGEGGGGHNIFEMYNYTLYVVGRNYMDTGCGHFDLRVLDFSSCMLIKAYK